MKKPVNLCSSTYCASSSAVSQPGCRFQDVASTWHTSHQVLTWGLSGSSCCSSLLQASALPLWVCLCRRLGGGLGPMLLHTQAFSSPLLFRILTHILRLQGLLLHVPQSVSASRLSWSSTWPGWPFRWNSKRKERKITPPHTHTLFRKQEPLYLFLCPEMRVISQGLGVSVITEVSGEMW